MDIQHAQLRREWLKCSQSTAYFINQWVYIYNATQREWIRFVLWPAQGEVLAEIQRHRYFVLLKARQLGMSWLCLAYALWLMLFRPAATILLFSKRDDEAIELLSRVQGMYNRLPLWMRARAIRVSNKHEFRLSNGSSTRAMPTTGGRSYTGTFVLLDEADFVPDLGAMLNSLKPTVDAGGQLVVISTVDKKRPLSVFKQVFRAAIAGENSYCGLFRSWRARPDRSEDWYTRIAADMRSQAGGSNDDLYQEYPETVEQALAPLELDKRIPFSWIEQCLVASEQCLVASGPWPVATGPSIPNLTIHQPPITNHSYVIGADPAEGNPNSDDSALTVLDAETWAEVAAYAGKCEPSVFAQIIDLIGEYYNFADVLCERNNHGHTVILKLQESGAIPLLNGYDNKPGWLTNIRGKPLLYNALADAIREGVCTIRTGETTSQIAMIEASTLRAPAGLHDDRAMSFALAVAALAYGRVGHTTSVTIHPPDPLDVYDQGRF